MRLDKKIKFIALKLGQRGLSLVEILIGVVVSSIVMLIAAVVLQTSSVNFFNLMTRIDTEEALSNAALAIQSHLSMALNLQVGTPPLTQLSNNVGLILRSYNLNSWASTSGNGNVDVISFFLRENLPSGWNYLKAPPSGAARFPVTVIYFQKPTVDRYGMLYIKSDSSSATSLIPSKADLRVPYLVDFEIIDVFSVPFRNWGNYVEDAPISDKEMVSSVTMKVTIRNYFGTSPGKKTWCPARFMSDNPACTTQVPFKDTEKVFVVKVRNNILGRGVLQRGRPAFGGDLDPPIYQRFADTVYFLKPSIPVGDVKR